MENIQDKFNIVTVVNIIRESAIYRTFKFVLKKNDNLQ